MIGPVYESASDRGSPEQVAERLAAYLAVGASNLVIVPFGSDVLTQYDLIAQARSESTRSLTAEAGG